jgi:PAS domain S-box-containing protein
MSSSQNTGTLLVNGAAILTIAWLLTEGLSGETILTGRREQSVHLVLALVLILAFAFRELIERRRRSADHEAHSLVTREIEREVTKRELRYQSILEGAGDAIFVINAGTGQLEEMNSMGTVLLGYSREELGTMSGRDLVPMRDQADFISLVRRVNHHGMARLDRITLKRKDGSRFLGEVNARLIDLGDSRVVQAIVRDITHQWQADEELREHNRKLALLNGIIGRSNESLDLRTVLDITLRETLTAFGSCGGAIHLVALDDGKFSLAANHNLPAAQVAASTCYDPVRDFPCQAATKRCCHAVTDFSRVGCALAGSVQEHGWKSVVGIPLTAQKRLVGIMHIMATDHLRINEADLGFFALIGQQIGIAIDHARMFAESRLKNEELLRSHGLLERSSRHLAMYQRRLEKNLAVVEQARQELENLDRMKKNVLGMISHEFKTPLTGILGGVEFLLEQNDRPRTGDELQVLDMIMQGGKQLNEIVTNFLKVMHLETSKEKCDLSAHRIDEILAAVQVQFGEALEFRSVSVIPLELETLPYIYGNREYLEEIFAELLVNAIKFTPDGGEILISGKVADKELLAGKQNILSRFNASFYELMGRESYLQVEVRDNGIGILYDDQPMVFEKFYEVGDICHHSSGKFKFQGKGAGLGLAIVKGMVEAHGGMVWVESPASDRPETTGSSFFVLLPLESGPLQQPLPFA